MRLPYHHLLHQASPRHFWNLICQNTMSLLGWSRQQPCTHFTAGERAHPCHSLYSWFWWIGSFDCLALERMSLHGWLPNFVLRTMWPFRRHICVPLNIAWYSYLSLPSVCQNICSPGTTWEVWAASCDPKLRLPLCRARRICLFAHPHQRVPCSFVLAIILAFTQSDAR